MMGPHFQSRANVGATSAQCGLLVNCSHQYVGSLGSKGHVIRVILTALKAKIDVFLDLKVQKVPILNEWKIPHLSPVCSHAIDTKSIHNFFRDKIMELESLNWRIRSKNRNAEISNNKDTMSAAITH